MSPRDPATVYFLSDYGLADEFAGVVKAVILRRAPFARIVDLTHEVPAHDVVSGARTLARAVPYLPPGVVLAVVDPGVATKRRAVAAEVAGGRVLVGPDNGVLSLALEQAGGPARAVVIEGGEPAPGPTFAGRDVFAPAVGRLCAGEDLSRLGTPADAASLVGVARPAAERKGDTLVTLVTWVDRFGNAQLSATRDEASFLGGTVGVAVRGSTFVARLVSTFDELRPGEPGIVVDSYGHLALVMGRASAATEMGIRADDEVKLALSGKVGR